MNIYTHLYIWLYETKVQPNKTTKKSNYFFSWFRVFKFISKTIQGSNILLYLLSKIWYTCLAIIIWWIYFKFKV
jgi:hypothetical protein